MSINQFALRIAVCNAIGYFASVWFPTYSATFLKHLPFSPSQEYNFLFGDYILIPTPIVFTLTYILITNKQNIIKKYNFLINFIIVVGIPYLTLPFCLPIPNYWILSVPVCFAILTTAAIIIHDYKIDLDYMYDEISEPVKLTKIKLEYDIWFKLFLSILTGYSVIAITYFSRVPEITGLITEGNNEHFQLFSLFVFAILLNVLVFIGTVCVEFVNKIIFIKNAITKKNGDRVSYD